MPAGTWNAGGKQAESSLEAKARTAKKVVNNKQLLCVLQLQLLYFVYTSSIGWRVVLLQSRLY